MVSSSGRLKGQGLGADIDEHDAVFRINEAATDGYEVDVGNKTTVRVVNEVILHNKQFAGAKMLVPDVPVNESHRTASTPQGVLRVHGHVCERLHEGAKGTIVTLARSCLQQPAALL